VRLFGGVAAGLCTEVPASLLIDWRMPGNRTRPLSHQTLAVDDM